MGRYRRLPIAMVLSLFVRPSIHVTNPFYVSVMDSSPWLWIVGRSLVRNRSVVPYGENCDGKVVF
jgi:hypothetical protein